MKIKPLGYYILVEMVTVETLSDGGIYIGDDLAAKEQTATDVGYVRAIGPTAYVGYPGCDLVKDKEVDGLTFPHTGHTPADNWGISIGDKIEYRAYEGKASSVPGHENYRYIPDSHIIGVIDDE